MTRGLREITDGGLDYPREALLPADPSPELIAAYPPVVAVPYRPILVEVDGAAVLLDTGAGPLGPQTGRLQNTLLAEGIAPDQISLVVLSHAHADHIGGLLDASGSPAFPNARIAISRREFEFWRDSGILGKLGSGSVYGNAALEAVVRDWFARYLVPLESRLELVDQDAELAPGIRLLPAPGHTPGHSAVLVSADSEPVLFTADAFALPEHISHPEWTSSFDLDAEETVRTRHRLLDLAAEQCRVIHYHVGSIGRIARRGARYEWVPEATTGAALPAAH
jgi:glyoxylase-like metal-dependent hydrolase (beta-lactamase superfamily II)